MKKQLSALSLLLLSFTARQASPENMKTEECRITMPGITFTRSLNGAAAHAKVEDGRLTLASEARRDNFRDPDGKLSNNTAPLLLTEVDNKQPFTLTAKVTPTFLKTYDAGTLYIYVKEDLWLKMAMEMDERNKTRMVSVRTIGTSDDNNHDVIEAKSVYMKISSDTKTIGFYYSLDNKSWQLIRLFKNDYPASIWVGISTQSPLGEGTSAVFEEISLTKQSIMDFRLGTDQASIPSSPLEVRTQDSALLPIPGAVLYNNVYGKGDITNYRQSIFRGTDDAGWEWDWPESGGPSLKNYPEVLVGRSPWSDVGGPAGAAGLSAGDQLPRRLAETRMTIDFDFSTVASGLWLGSFDFWITRSDHPTTKDIVSNLTIWTMNHGVTNTYKGRHMTLKIGGRTYEAIFETPAEQPDKPWKTLCLVDTEPRSKGTLELGPLMEALIANGLAQPSDFLATAEFGTEVAYGKGRTTLRSFSLR
jgi:regulation of enolase protein 1 (concanavalin A-like superfamily)